MPALACYIDGPSKEGAFRIIRGGSANAYLGVQYNLNLYWDSLGTHTTNTITASSAYVQPIVYSGGTFSLSPTYDATKTAAYYTFDGSEDAWLILTYKVANNTEAQLYAIPETYAGQIDTALNQAVGAATYSWAILARVSKIDLYIYPQAAASAGSTSFTTTVVSAGGVGKVLDLGVAPQTPPAGWTTLAYDDSAWSASLHNTSEGLPLTIPGAQWVSYTTATSGIGDQVWLLRHSFSLPSGTVIPPCMLKIQADDYLLGAYLNGTFIYGPGAGTPAATEADIPLSTTVLLPGASNILAIEVQNQSSGTSDPTSVAYAVVATQSTSGTLNTIIVADSGTVVGTEPEINFIAGSGVSLTVADNPSNDRVDVTIAASGAGTLELTDGTTDLTAVTKITVTNMTVGGTPAAATLVPVFSVTDGTTTKTSVKEINFTSGATVSSGGTGIANVAISGGSLTVTDGTHTVTGTTQITFSGATVSGTTPNATVTVTGGGGSSSFSWATKTTTYTITTADTGILADATSASFTLTLPTAVGATQAYTIKKKDSSSHTVTIATTSAQTIDGAATYVISVPNMSVNVGSDGSNWFIF